MAIPTQAGGLAKGIAQGLNIGMMIQDRRAKRAKEQYQKEFTQFKVGLEMLSLDIPDSTKEKVWDGMSNGFMKTGLGIKPTPWVSGGDKKQYKQYLKIYDLVSQGKFPLNDANREIIAGIKKNQREVILGLYESEKKSQEKIKAAATAFKRKVAITKQKQDYDAKKNASNEARAILNSMFKAAGADKTSLISTIQEGDTTKIDALLTMAKTKGLDLERVRKLIQSAWGTTLSSDVIKLR